ncbi:MAG: hypothetical protein AAGE59_36005 [Cyanobacteria bacterium P01_F01_bin.86]
MDSLAAIKDPLHRQITTLMDAHIHRLRIRVLLAIATIPGVFSHATVRKRSSA